MNEGELRKEIGVNKTRMEQVVASAKLCKKAGLDGVVYSSEEVMAIKEACGDDFITATHGIRFLDSKKDAQTKAVTPACANLLGCDYIVVGKSITKADDVVETYTRCKKDFTEEVTNEIEIENAKKYIIDLQGRVIENAKNYAIGLLEKENEKIGQEQSKSVQKRK